MTRMLLSRPESVQHSKSELVFVDMSQLFLNPTTYCYATNVASVTPGYAAALAAAHSVLNNSCSTCMATSLIAAVARATAAASPKGVPTGDDGPLLNVWSDARIELVRPVLCTQTQGELETGPRPHSGKGVLQTCTLLGWHDTPPSKQPLQCPSCPTNTSSAYNEAIVRPKDFARSLAMNVFLAAAQAQRRQLERNLAMEV